MDASDHDDDVGSSIHEVAKQCQEALRKCTHLWPLMEYEWAENRLAEFSLWAAGTGAFALERASLDSRLAIEWETKSLVINLLILLLGCIDKCQKAVSRQQDEVSERAPSDDGVQEFLQPPAESWDSSGPIPRSFSPWSDMSSSESDDEEERAPQTDTSSTTSLVIARAEVEQIIDQLTRLAVAIRKSGTNSRALKADRRFNLADHQELRDHLNLLILARGREQGRDDYGVDPSWLSPVQERLVLANLRRRNRFLYAQRHAQKLAFDDLGSQPKSSIPVLNDPAILPEGYGQTEREKTPITVGQSPAAGEALRRPVVMTATSASAVGAPIEPVPRGTATPSQMAKTNITSTAAKVVYPNPPRLKPGVRYFLCPCCCQALPEMFRQNTLWKKHLIEDICPYTCIIEDCSTPDTLYVSRFEWMKHVRKDHQQCWECLPCTIPGKIPLIFPSVEGFLHHTEQVHGDTISSAQHSTLLLDAARPVPSGISRCPLCDETAPADSDPLFDHIAEHLHSFALRSLPWPKDEYQIEGDTSRDYFEVNDYFDDGSEDQSNQYNVFSESDRDSDGLASLHSNSSDFGSPITDRPMEQDISLDRVDESGRLRGIPLKQYPEFWENSPIYIVPPDYVPPVTYDPPTRYVDPNDVPIDEDTRAQLLSLYTNKSATHQWKQFGLSGYEDKNPGDYPDKLQNSLPPAIEDTASSRPPPVEPPSDGKKQGSRLSRIFRRREKQ